MNPQPLEWLLEEGVWEARGPLQKRVQKAHPGIHVNISQGSLTVGQMDPRPGAKPPYELNKASLS